MPELPEVQTIVSDLNRKIVGYTITDFWSDWTKAIKNVTVAQFKRNIKGRKIINVSRIGKNIFIELEKNKTVYVHLKMTGHLLVKAKGNPPAGGQRAKKGDYFSEKVNQYIHHIWFLEKGKEKLTLEFSDLRKFAKIVLLETDKIRKYPDIRSLGVDAMDRNFTLEVFYSILKKKEKLLIGAVLMEQHLIAGIGNIYRSEILFEAGVSPFRKVKTLSDEEIEKIYNQTKEVLKKAIVLRGTSDSDYRDTEGAPGGFQKVLKVYNREKQPCQRRGCQGVVKRSALAQRSAFWCEKCQK